MWDECAHVTPSVTHGCDNGVTLLTTMAGHSSGGKKQIDKVIENASWEVVGITFTASGSPIKVTVFTGCAAPWWQQPVLTLPTGPTGNSCSSYHTPELKGKPTPAQLRL